MGDLIRIQDAIKAVANYLWHYPNEQYKNLNVFEVGESLVKDALSIVPSADAVEVVRCKDCKWYESDGGALMVCARIELVADDNDYCSWGERREP